MSSSYDLFETTREAVDKFLAEDRAKRVAEAIIAIDDPQKRIEVEAQTRRNYLLREQSAQAEERHRMAQAQRLK